MTEQSLAEILSNINNYLYENPYSRKTKPHRIIRKESMRLPYTVLKRFKEDVAELQKIATNTDDVKLAVIAARLETVVDILEEGQRPNLRDLPVDVPTQVVD